MRLDNWMAVCLALIAVWILINGLDDRFIDFVFFAWRSKPFPWPAEAALAQAQQRRIAIFVTLWREHKVVEQMSSQSAGLVVRQLRYLRTREKPVRSGLRFVSLQMMTPRLRDSS